MFTTFLPSEMTTDAVLDKLRVGEVIVTIFGLDGSSIEELGDESYKAKFQNTATILDVKTRFCTDLLTDNDNPNEFALCARRGGPAIENNKTLKDFAKKRHVRLFVYALLGR